MEVMKKLSVFAPSLLMTGALFLGACGGSSKSADTTVAVDTTAAVESTVAAESSETTVASETSSADTTVATKAATDTTVAPVATETSVATGAAAPAGEVPAAVAQMATALGITEQKDLDCITSKLDPTAAPVAGVDPKLVQALISCQPPTLVDAAKGQLAARLPNATPEQLDCIARASLSVLGESEGDVLTALSAGATALPAELMDKFLDKAKSCGIPDDELKKAMA
jgi:hypothetical protein